MAEYSSTYYTIIAQASDGTYHTCTRAELPIAVQEATKHFTIWKADHNPDDKWDWDKILSDAEELSQLLGPTHAVEVINNLDGERIGSLFHAGEELDHWCAEEDESPLLANFIKEHTVKSSSPPPLIEEGAPLIPGVAILSTYGQHKDHKGQFVSVRCAGDHNPGYPTDIFISADERARIAHLMAPHAPILFNDRHITSLTIDDDPEFYYLNDNGDETFDVLDPHSAIENLDRTGLKIVAGGDSATRWIEATAQFSDRQTGQALWVELPRYTAEELSRSYGIELDPVGKQACVENGIRMARWYELCTPQESLEYSLLDLRHLADHFALDFEAADRDSYSHYQEERDKEWQPSRLWAKEVRAAVAEEWVGIMELRDYKGMSAGLGAELADIAKHREMTQKEVYEETLQRVQEQHPEGKGVREAMACALYTETTGVTPPNMTWVEAYAQLIQEHGEDTMTTLCGEIAENRGMDRSEGAAVRAACLREVLLSREEEIINSWYRYSTNEILEKYDCDGTLRQELAVMQKQGEMSDQAIYDVACKQVEIIEVLTHLAEAQGLSVLPLATRDSIADAIVDARMADGILTDEERASARLALITQVTRTLEAHERAAPSEGTTPHTPTRERE